MAVEDQFVPPVVTPELFSDFRFRRFLIETDIMFSKGSWVLPSLSSDVLSLSRIVSFSSHCLSFLFPLCL